jgi:hypothetical protein
VRWEASLPPTREAKVKIIEGSPAEAARILVDGLIAEKVI